MKLPSEITKEQLRTISRAVRAYYHNAPFAFLPSPEDFVGWLDTLSDADRYVYESRGMTHCGDIMAFKRHYFERRGYKMVNFLTSTLAPEDYLAWLLLDIDRYPFDLPPSGGRESTF